MSEMCAKHAERVAVLPESVFPAICPVCGVRGCICAAGAAHCPDGLTRAVIDELLGEVRTLVTPVARSVSAFAWRVGEARRERRRHSRELARGVRSLAVAWPLLRSVDRGAA
jgi:hypothetical protein